jgi:Ca-activated chloride channel homolog
MNRRPLSHPYVLPAALASLFAAAGCSLMEPAARRAPPEAEDEERPRYKMLQETTAEAPAAGEAAATGTEVSGSKGGERQEKNKKTTIEFSDSSVEGDLSKPGGEHVESKKRTKHETLIPPRYRPAKPDKRVEDSDDFDAAFGSSDGKKGGEKKEEQKDFQSEPRRTTLFIPPAPGQASQPTTPKPPPSNGPVATPTPEPVVVMNGHGTKAPEKPKEPPKETPRVREENTDPASYLRHYGVNPTIEANDERFSTFAADVDTGSYTIARGYLERGAMPPEAAVRVEEVVNSFDYGYRAPEKEAFAVQVEAFPSPNRKGYHVLHLGLKGKEIKASARKGASLVFTIDVSGSMDQPNRLPLAKQALGLLLEQLDERDQVSIVVYGDQARVVLPPTNATQKERIAAAIHALRSEGSTNVQAGLELAYTMALKAFKPEGVNRVILLSDGVANNGITDADGIFGKVKSRASEGITLTTIGFGMSDYNDVLMERLADQGDGQYAYVDKLEEARRIFVEQLTGTLQVIAKDVKLQLEFNPEAVARYRLLGFENRALSKQDFHDDKKDAGELGAGHSVTAIYEVKFKSRAPKFFATFRARFKEPRSTVSGLVEKQLPMDLVKDSVAASSGPARLSLVAAGYAEKLRGSYWARNLQWGELLEMWETLPEGLKTRPRVAELKALMMKARALDRRPDRFEREMPVASMDFDRVPVLR